MSSGVDARSDAPPEDGYEDGSRKQESTERSRPDEVHDLHVVVWDVPPTIESGERFALKVGLKCASACGPDGWAIAVHDHEGNTRATAPPGDEHWPGTAGLHYAEVTLEAPEAAGLYRWRAEAEVAGRDDTTDTAIPHDPGVAEFRVRVVARPECLVTVRAVDRENHNPVDGVRVVVHPYRTATDANGVATLRVPKGDYRLFVSGRGYLPFRKDCEIARDVTVEAELDLDAGPSDADVWS